EGAPLRSTKIRAGLALAVAAALSLAVVGCSGGGEPAAGGDTECAWPDTNVKIGGGVTGGLYVLMGASLEKLLDDKTPCASGTTSTGNSLELIRDGVDIAFGQTDTLYSATSGDGGQGFQPGESYPYLTMGVMWTNASIMLT